MRSGRCRGPTDIAQLGRNALVFGTGDSQAMMRNIVNLRDDTLLFERMSASSREIYAKHDLSMSLRGLRQAIESVTGHRTLRQ